jgi:hypothetical protein
VLAKMEVDSIAELTGLAADWQSPSVGKAR